MDLLSDVLAMRCLSNDSKFSRGSFVVCNLNWYCFATGGMQFEDLVQLFCIH